MTKRRAVITGITGMDGSYLAELLLEKDYQVFGLIRKRSSECFWRIAHLLSRIELIDGDLLDQGSLNNTFKRAQPHEIYNLAAQSFVHRSFETPIHTADVTGLGALRVLEAARQVCNRAVRIFQASSSEMFGSVQEIPQIEKTPFYPRSPYGCAKAFAHRIMVNYRESYGMHINCGISFNHESERRGEEFVTRKISLGVAAIAMKIAPKITLGNLNAARDWGYAPDYVKAFWLMMQQDKPADYVISTGVSHTIKDFLREAFAVIGIYNYMPYVATDPRYMRPADVWTLLGNSSKIREELGWRITTSFKDLVAKMVKADLARLKGAK